MELIDYTLGGILEKWVREQPDHEFMIYPDRGLRFSYKEFDERRAARSAYGPRTCPTG